jgi:hypothetical protein
MKGLRGSVDNLFLHTTFITSVNTGQKEVETKELIEEKKTKNNQKKFSVLNGKEKKK